MRRGLGMQDLVKLEWPHEAVALVTLTDTAPQHNLTCNGVTQLADALEKARKAGARVSVLASGVPGATDNVRIVSVIGRFLEHSRIYYFQNGAEDPVGGEFYLGSADWMRRNLSERVEAVTPVEAAPLRARLW